MFDAETASIIRSAPPLPGLDAISLPELLTRTHARIAALRLRLRETRPEAATQITPTLAMLRKLARTYQAYAVSLPLDEHRAPAAYVAATAYQLLGRAAQAGIVPEDRGPSELTRSSVPASVSALLLYLAAGFPTDAREVGESIEPLRTASFASSLLTALIAFSRGDLPRILRRKTGESDRIFQRDDPATEALYQRILFGLQILIADILGEGRPEGAPAGGASEVFAEVQRLAVAVEDWGEWGKPFRFDVLPGVVSALEGDVDGRIATTYSGPHHVASLLNAATDRLLEDAITRVPPPPGVESDRWNAFTRKIARTRAFLWINHQEAIRARMLVPGVSAVVSYPTGAGKSTLSELKIAATHFRNKKVVFLAPTRALVLQTYYSLRATFGERSVVDSPVESGAYEETDREDQAPIVVMTPERCLNFLGSHSDTFRDVGLVVFDECHLMHPRDGSEDRRSLDAMLCLLGLLDRSDSTDVLLMSAMVRNAKELADWIGYATGRTCLWQSTTWKPTRQARGCVVFSHGEIVGLSDRVDAARRASASPNPSNKLKASLVAKPLGLFSLTQTWLREVTPEKFTLFPLIAEEIRLAVSKRWTLTPNKNELAAELAARMASDGVKVIVFVQNKLHCKSICDLIFDTGILRSEELPLTSTEQRCLAAAEADVGDAGAVMGPIHGIGTTHNSLMLPSERRLAESVFGRRDGVNVLVATPTLAQGMNLPAEAVLICGDKRFNAEMGDRERIAAHELLNAAGRAGRAGHHASGFVLVIPDSIITTARSEHEVNPPLAQLIAELLSKSDQCLDVSDPIDALLDRVEVRTASSNSLLRYFVTRLPVSSEVEDPSMAAQRVLGRSLGAFRAFRLGDSTQFQMKLEAALAVRRAIAGTKELLWIDLISSATGLPPARISQIDKALQNGCPSDSATVMHWLEWMFELLGSDRTLIQDVFDRPRFVLGLTIEQQRRARKANLDWVSLLPEMRTAVSQWMQGSTLAGLEATLNPPYRSTGQCRAARAFVTQFMLELSSYAGTVAQVRRRQLAVTAGVEVPLPQALAVFSACIREGFDSAVKLAVRYSTDIHSVSRIECHNAGASIAHSRPDIGSMANFVEIRKAVFREIRF